MIRAKMVKSCPNRSNLRPKYYRSFFSGHGVDTDVHCKKYTVKKFSQLNVKLSYFAKILKTATSPNDLSHTVIFQVGYL